MDVVCFSKLPMQFGFSIAYTGVAGNLRHDYPDFVAVATDDTHYVIETKGRDATDVTRKDAAATMWCDGATLFTNTAWRFLKVRQKDFEGLQPATLEDSLVFAQAGSHSGL